MHVSDTHELRRRAARLFAALLLTVSLTAGAVTRAAGQSAGRARPAPASASAGDAAKFLREGRDLLDARQWARAADAFTRLLDAHPRDANAAPALYWLAFALKMQGKYPEAARQLERLIGQFPQSTWVEDARVMQVELANQLGDERALDDALRGDNSERQLIALQSLLQTDPRGALAHSAQLLKSESASSQTLRESVVSLLGRSGGPAAAGLLIEVARDERDEKLRRAATLALGQPGNEGALDFLGELLSRREGGELADSAAFAISRIGGARARALLIGAAKTSASPGARSAAVTSLSRLGGGDLAVDDLTQLYQAETDVAVRKNIIHALSRIAGPRAQERLLELARTSDDLELRKQAIFWAGRQDDPDQGADGLARLYDAERNEEAKQLLIYKLARLKSKNALRKLMEIARADASAEMRKRAIFWLNRSRDPEAAQFLRELKQ